MLKINKGSQLLKGPVYEPCYLLSAGVLTHELTEVEQTQLWFNQGAGSIKIGQVLVNAGVKVMLNWKRDIFYNDCTGE